MTPITINKPNETVILSVEDFDMQNLPTQDFAILIASDNTTLIMPDMSKVKGSPNFYIGVIGHKTGCKLLPPSGKIFLSKLYQNEVEFDTAPLSTITLKYFIGDFYIVVGTSD